MPIRKLHSGGDGGLVPEVARKAKDLDPVIRSLAQYLNAESRPQVAAQHALNAEYFRRIDALNFTMAHDDGQAAENLESADVVLIGISRTSKTPTSICL